MSNIESKIILVTEATNPASQRIIRYLLLKGAEVIISSKNLIDLHRIRADLKLENALECRMLHLLPFDLRDAQDADCARKIIEKQWKGLDVIVTNYCAIDSNKGLMSSDENDWQNYINNETKGHFTIAKTFMPLLASRPDSMFIAISKNAATYPTIGRSLSDASMAIQMMLARNLSYEIRGNPDVHCLIFSDEIGGSKDEDRIVLSNISEATITLIENSDWVKGHFEYGSNWRDQMTPPDQSYCVGGI